MINSVIFMTSNTSNTFEKNEILSIEASKNTLKELIKNLNLDSDKLILGVFPGSRNQEFSKHIKPILDAIKLIKKQLPNLQVVICQAPEVNYQIKESTDNSILVHNNSHDILAISDFSIVAIFLILFI